MAQRSTTATLCCLKTEIELQNIAGGLYQNLQLDGRTFGTAAAIEDNTGTALTNIMNVRKASPDGANGVKYDVKYQIPRCDETATDDVDFDCVIPAAAQPDYGYEEMYFNNYVAEEFSMRSALFDTRCEDPSMELAKELAHRVQSMYTKYNRKLTTMLNAKAGTVYGETDDTQTTNLAPASLKLFKPLPDGSSAPQPMGLNEMLYQYQRMAPSGAAMPVMVGDSKALSAFNFAQPLYGGNEDGLDINNVGNSIRGTYLDWSITSTLAGGPALNPVLSFLPGSIELVEFFRFDNPNDNIGPDGRITWAPVQASGTLTRQRVDVGTPILGRRFDVDLQIHFDECTNTVSYKMRKEFDLFNIPQAAFCTDAYWNYIMLWDITCEAYNCVDVLNPVAPAE